MSNIYQAKGTTLVEQYFDAGQLFRITIQQSVQNIAKSKSKLLAIRRTVAEKTWHNLKDKSELKEFIDCFVAWSKGAEISPEQAMWLMADNLSGCQTVIARYASGVALLHSEEEFRDTQHIELHMTDPHTISFDDNGEKLTSLVYNNLFPGSGLYGWQKDKIVAVDSIFLKEEGIESMARPLLANVVAWIVWKMRASEADPERIVSLIKELGVLVDGYVINVVRKTASGIEGYKLILARDESRIEYLGDKLGDSLKQVNIIEPTKYVMQWALPPKRIWRGGWKYFTGRIKTLSKHIAQYQLFCQYPLTLSLLPSVHAHIQRIIFSDLAGDYVSPDLGAVCVGFVDEAVGTSVSCKLNDQQSIQTLAYIDTINS
jgi:hypothetical protein